MGSGGNVSKHLAEQRSLLLDRNASEMSPVGGGLTLSARCDLRPTTPLPCPVIAPPIFCVSGGCGGLTCDTGFYTTGQWFLCRGLVFKLYAGVRTCMQR